MGGKSTKNGRIGPTLKGKAHNKAILAELYGAWTISKAKWFITDVKVNPFKSKVHLAVEKEAISLK